MSRLVAAVCALMLLAAGCGDDDGEEVSSGDDTTTEAEPTTTTASGDEGEPVELPGESIDIYPYEGAELAVVGVASDDVLNVRAGPGVDFDAEFTLDPLHIGATATGNNRQLPDGPVWAEITDDGRTGWASTAYLLQPGQVTDATAELYPTPADRPSAPSMEELAATVAGDAAADTAEVTIVDGPTEGDLHEVTVDVLNLRDDAVGGVRLQVFAEAAGGSFTVRTVERTFLCIRGVTDEGLCL